MDTSAAENLFQLPEEMLHFTIDAICQRCGPRLGRLSLHNRASTPTPNYVALTSRGVVPHLSQDNLARHTNVRSLYFALEDFIEKTTPRVPPIHKTAVAENSSKLRSFTAQPADSLLILGPRRFPPVETPQGNSIGKIALSTSVGFQSLDVDSYVEAGIDLRPDIILAPGDIALDRKPSQKRVGRMGDRSAAWLMDALALREGAASVGNRIAMFAPILPVDHERQRLYLERLVEDCGRDVDGLYVYDAASVVDLPRRLDSLPRLGFLDVQCPSDILHAIELGVDLFVMPFLGAATDAGIALDFVFPPPGSSSANATSNGCNHQPEDLYPHDTAHSGVDGPANGDADGLANGHPEESRRKPLGTNLWDTMHATDTSAFATGCGCYACTRHHRAYLNHLLHAKEMLAWVLLQIHNHRVMDKFFEDIRQGIRKGTFVKDRQAFDQFYETELPVTGGRGPRMRGYQFKSVGNGEARKNPKAFNKLDGTAEALAEAEVPSLGVDSEQLAT